MQDAKKYWNDRGKKYGVDHRGVLFDKPYPKWFNSAFHLWSLKMVFSKIEDGDKILDIGCGYGRVSEEILQKFPNASTRGVDISESYVALYNKSLSPRAKAKVGDLRKLPFNEKFDLIFMIATFMYVTNKLEQKKALSDMGKLLKRGGKIVLIERTSLMDLSDVRKKGKQFKQGSFTKKKVANLLIDTKMKIHMEKAWPSSLLPLYRAYFITLNEN